MERSRRYDHPEEDPWNRQAFDDWVEVEKEIASVITERMRREGMEIPEGKGMYGRIQPFLEKYLKDIG